MNLNRIAAGVMLTLWSWSASANGQEQKAFEESGAGFQFPADSPMSFRGGPAWLDESMPLGAIPGDRHITGGNVFIAASGDGKQLFAFSGRHPKWVEPSVAPPGDPKIVLIADDNVAAAWSGAYCFAYSGLLGRWDVLHLTGDEPARPTISRGAVGVDLKDTDYVFRAEWGKWFSAEDIKAGRVAEYLAKAPAESSDEGIKVFELIRADASKMAELMQSLLADKQLSIVADARTNSMIVRGPEASLAIVEAICLKLDIHGPETATSRADSVTAPAVDLATLRERYEAEDKAAHKLATKIRGAEAHLSSGENGVPPLGYSRQQSAIVGMRRELREKVTAAFRTRQELIAAQVADLERRIVDLRESLALREAAVEQVIERRVEDLLDPSLKWNGKTKEATLNSDASDGGPQTPQENGEAPTAAKLSRRMAATVSIHEEGKSSPLCSGAVISPAGAILTQLPANRAGGKLTARFDDGGEVEVSTWLEPGSRLVVLTPTKPIRVQHYFPLSTEELQEGETLHVLYFGGSSGQPTYAFESPKLTFKSRKVLGFDRPVLQLQTSFGGYQCGSPVSNDRGELVGLHVIMNEIPSSGRAFAIPIATILAMCKESGMDLAAALASPAKDSADASD